MAVHLVVAGDVFDGVLFCAVPLEMSWMRSGTELSNFLSIFLATLSHFYSHFFSELPLFQSEG